MSFSEKLDSIKKLETMVVLQKDCLSAGNWDDFDRIENEIKKLEETIVSQKE